MKLQHFLDIAAARMMRFAETVGLPGEAQFMTVPNRTDCRAGSRHR